jgi:hypothetical protein
MHFKEVANSYKSFYWENGDLIAKINGQAWRLVNPYPVNISYGDLEYSSSEEITVELTLKYEKT